MRFLQLKKCHTCGALGVGPLAVDLWPLDDLLYCEQGTPEKPGCYRQALSWHESRGEVIIGLQHELAIFRKSKKRAWRAKNWQGYIQELSGIAGWALEVGDRRTFIHYFTRAVLAWGLREVQGAKE